MTNWEEDQQQTIWKARSGKFEARTAIPVGLFGPRPTNFWMWACNKTKENKKRYRSQVQGAWSEPRVDAGMHYSKLFWHVPRVSCSLQERLMHQIMVLPSFTDHKSFRLWKLTHWVGTLRFNKCMLNMPQHYHDINGCLWNYTGNWSFEMPFVVHA